MDDQECPGCGDEVDGDGACCDRCLRADARGRLPFSSATFISGGVCAACGRRGQVAFCPSLAVRKRICPECWAVQARGATIPVQEV